MNVATAFLLVGLGNPGAEYERTRHNTGYMVLDELARRHGISVKQRSRLALSGQGTINGVDVVMCKPLTYMNLSGQAVTSMRTKHAFDLSHILVLVDDFCLPMGRLRVRKGGGTGGHNGLANITECLGSKEFPRVRLGIGPAPAGRDPIDFVLGKFFGAEIDALQELIPHAADVVEYILEHDIDAAMNKYNGIQ